MSTESYEISTDKIQETRKRDSLGRFGLLVSCRRMAKEVHFGHSINYVSRIHHAVFNQSNL